MGLAWLFRRRKKPAPAPADPAEELKRKLEESREAPAAEPEAEPAGGSLDERRRAVHDRARAAIDEMRGNREVDGGDEPGEG